MKVAVYLRADFDDESRRQIAGFEDGVTNTSLFRLAGRDEIKAFYSLHGESWKDVLNAHFGLLPSPEEEEKERLELELEDLI